MRIKKNLVQVVATLAVALTAMGAMSTKAEAKLNNIKVSAPSGKTVKVAMGKKVKLKVTVKKLKNKKVSFKSNNAKIVKVNSKGVVYGLKNGKTKITVTSKKNPNIQKIVKVIVYKNAVKKIKLNKTNVSLNAGEQCKLKAKIKPAKNVSKVLKYTSSNKKVVTVTKEGVIKAVAAGTANITVKSTDGSNKKAVCNVTVKKANDSKQLLGIKKVSVRCAYALNVELTSAKKLDYADFNVYRYYVKGSKNKDELCIDSVNTVDNIHYEIALDDTKSNSLEFNSLVKVEINALPGVKQKEIRIDSNYTYDTVVSETVADRYVFGEIGQNIVTTVSFGKDYYGRFKQLSYAEPLDVSFSNVPEGISVGVTNTYSDSYDRTYGDAVPYVYIYGTFKDGLDGHKMVITGIDANGKKLQLNVYFYVSDYFTDYSKAIDKTCLTYKPYESDFDCGLRGESDYTPTVAVSGESEDYYSINYNYSKCSGYSATGLPDNVVITNDGKIKVDDYDKDVKAGVYNITISCTTSRGENIKIPYKLTLIDGFIVKGKYTYADGKPCGHSRIYFEKNYEYNNQSYGRIDAFTDYDGEYKIRLKPGNYNISEWSGEHVYSSYQNELKKSKTLNIKNNFYKVIFTNEAFAKIHNYVFEEYEIKIESSKGNGSDAFLVQNFTGRNDDGDIYEFYAYLRSGTYKFVCSTGYRIKIDGVNYKITTTEFKVTGSGTIKLKIEKDS